MGFTTSTLPPEIASLNRVELARRLPSCIAVGLSNTPGRQLARLWLADPCCHWCGSPTHLNAKGYPPALRATRDHVKSRSAGRQVGEKTDVVLACHQCNQGRNHVELKTLAGKRVSHHLLARFAGTPTLGAAQGELALGGAK